METQLQSHYDQQRRVAPLFQEDAPPKRARTPDEFRAYESRLQSRKEEMDKQLDKMKQYVEIHQQAQNKPAAAPATMDTDTPDDRRPPENERGRSRGANGRGRGGNNNANRRTRPDSYGSYVQPTEQRDETRTFSQQFQYPPDAARRGQSPKRPRTDDEQQQYNAKRSRYDGAWPNPQPPWPQRRNSRSVQRDAHSYPSDDQQYRVVHQTVVPQPFPSNVQPQPMPTYATGPDSIVMQVQPVPFPSGTQAPMHLVPPISVIPVPQQQQPQQLMQQQQPQPMQQQQSCSSSSRNSFCSSSNNSR